MKTPVQYGALAILTLLLIVKGILPAWTGVETDFPNYYTASRLFIEGTDHKKFYHDQWFNEQIHRYGIDQEGKFSPFPPLTVFLMVPVAMLDPITAKRVWTIFNMIFLALNIFLIHQITKKSYLWSSVLILLSGWALINTIRLGQVYLMLSCFIMLAYYLWQQGAPGEQSKSRFKQISAGAILGIGTALKYFPFIYLVIFGIKREWKVALGGLTTILLLGVLSIAVFGLDMHREFLYSGFLPHLTGKFSNQTPYSISFQSWNSLLRTIFVFDAELNPSPLFDWKPGFEIMTLSITALVLAITGYVLYRIERILPNEATPIQLALAGLSALVLLPASATYHFLFLVFPVAILMTNLKGKQFENARWTMMALYAAVGFLPIGLLRSFTYKGMEIIFAYPRLLLVTSLFLVAARSLLRVTKQAAVDASKEDSEQQLLHYVH